MQERPSRHWVPRSFRLTEGRKGHHVPPGTGTLGMWLFLAALTMLFAASLVGYVVIRVRGESAPPDGALSLPDGLWVSTGLILISSFTIHRALQNVRGERQMPFRNSLLITLLLAVGFLLVQAPAMADLLHTADQLEQRLYALMSFLVLVHALHILGGLVPLTIITWRAHRGRYDHEFHAPVKYVAMYWHFLDGVWVVMFLVFQLAG